MAGARALQQSFAGTDDRLGVLERGVSRDLEMLLPAANWIPPHSGPGDRPMLDVVVIGAGMYGIAASIALQLRGITNTMMLDQAEDGMEGPWVTYARMTTLRSPKQLPGPCLGIPSLTFRSWYEASFGPSAWDALYKIENATWQAYLTWIRRVMRLPLHSGVSVSRIVPTDPHVTLQLVGGGELLARRVVIATGRSGTGGPYVPEWISRVLWPSRAAHSSEAIDFARLKGLRVAVIGAGASAWDNAATALEAGAAHVDMYCRRATLPQVNKGRGSATPGYFEGWAELDVPRKWEMFVYLQDHAAPPPHETVLRTIAHPGFQIHLGTPVLSAFPTQDGVAIRLPDRTEDADFLIAGTGFAIDLAREPMLAAFAGRIATWGDRYQPPPSLRRPSLAAYPFLGGGFQLQAIDDGQAGAINRVHMFNHAALASLGAIASDIPGVNAGANRLASSIAAAFFSEDFEVIRTALIDYNEAELAPTPFYIQT